MIFTVQLARTGAKDRESHKKKAVPGDGFFLAICYMEREPALPAGALMVPRPRGVERVL